MWKESDARQSTLTAQIKYWPSPGGALLRACTRVMAWIYKRSMFIFRIHAWRGISALVCFVAAYAQNNVCIWCLCDEKKGKKDAQTDENGVAERVRFHSKYTHTYTVTSGAYLSHRQTKQSEEVNWDFGSAIICILIKHTSVCPLPSSGPAWASGGHLCCSAPACLHWTNHRLLAGAYTRRVGAPSVPLHFRSHHKMSAAATFPFHRLCHLIAFCPF